MLVGGLLTFLLMASALAYEMAFLEELDPEIGEFDPEGAIWNRYNNGIGCTEIPPNPSGYVEEIILRVARNEPEPPALMIERALDVNSRAGSRSDETDPFEEMYFFERNQPNVWISLVQQLREVRDAAMAAGLYIPIPLGLRSRYSDEDLNALGLTIDPETEEEILRDLVDPTRQNPDIANVMIRPIYQIFTGSYPEIWNYLLENSGWAAENENQNAEMSEIDLLVPGGGPQRSVSRSVGEHSNILSNEQLFQPGNSVSNDREDRRALASEHSMEFEEEASSPSFRWEDSNLDANAECMIHDICIEDKP
ncbi:hypothetical protein TWF703_001753 [Orbilia oligospora]|uniref:Uncharacterized protein n=1 Tax=Orbilia oligospora TaxID=2813651 RepID=A0A7C8JU31_ORBOL|nr:hypothetical protein TWF703_001753 [Orbilia oligospora]